jgi:hypothetical protein
MATAAITPRTHDRNQIKQSNEQDGSHDAQRIRDFAVLNFAGNRPQGVEALKVPKCAIGRKSKAIHPRQGDTPNTQT